MSLDEKLQAFFDKIDLRLQSVEQKLDKRLAEVENRCDKYESTLKKHNKVQNKLSNDVSKLKVTVNLLEQKNLERHVIIKGIPECDKDTEDLVGTLFNHLNPNFESYSLLNCHRIGTKKDNKHRLILAELKECEHKMALMKGITTKNVNSSIFKKEDGSMIGQTVAKVFVSDHLTKYSANLFYRARQLKKKNLIKYAWTKLGTVFVKKDDNSRAIKISSVEQLIEYEKELEVELDDDEEQVDLDSDIETSSKASTDSKRQRSPSKVAGRRSPSKRLKSQQK